MSALAAFLEPYYTPVFLALLGLQLLMLLFLLYNHKETRRLEVRLRRLAETGEGHDLAAVLERFNDLSAVQKFLDQLQERVTDLQVGLEKSFSRMGLVRFNAFPDTGSDLSFALALLNREGDGFILTSLYARDETRVFIKNVRSGRPGHRLSDEEEKALALALGLLAPEKAAS